MKIKFLPLFGLALTFAACNGPAKKASTDTSADSTNKVSAVLPDEDKVSDVLKDYYTLKDNLVASDSAAAKTSAAKLETELAGVKGCNEAAGVAGQIAATANLSSQREQFLTLSKDVITLAKGFVKGKPAYVAFCPMTNKGKGGYWLTDTKEIKNPYYGKAMLTCGSIKEEIK
jgi:hypothetical protein